MTAAVTCHGGTNGVDKAGSSFLVSEFLYPLDQILQSNDSWMMCRILENDATCSMGCAMENIHQRRAMTSVVTCHGGTDCVDKAGSSFLDTALSFPLDQSFQSYDSTKRCRIVENDATLSQQGVPLKTFIRGEM
jgi:hypothetical protein